MHPVRLERGYAADCAADPETGGVWVASAACLSDEESLLAEISRTWPTRPGVTAEEWRNRPPAPFTLTLSRLSGRGEATESEEMARNTSGIEGPAMAGGASGGERPLVAWIERRDEEYEVRLWRGGQSERVATSGTPLHSPAVAVDAGGEPWVAWVSETGNGGEVRVWCDARPAGGETLTVSQPGTSNWSPALTVDHGGAVWCAWDSWSADGSGEGRYEIVVRRRRPPTSRKWR